MSLFTTVALAYNNDKVAEAQLLVQRLLPAYSAEFPVCRVPIITW
jgi:hypothetical protein